MIDSITISGFRGIRHLELSELGAINLFVGPNGSGKTTLLQAVFLFCLEADTNFVPQLAPPESDELDAEAIERALLWLFRRSGSTHASEGILVSGKVGGRPREVALKRVDRVTGLRPANVGAGAVVDNGGPKQKNKPHDLVAIKDSASLVLEMALTKDDVAHTGQLYVSHKYGIFAESPKLPVSLPARFIGARHGRFDLAKSLDDTQEAGLYAQVFELLNAMDADVAQLKIGVASDGSPVVRVDHRRLGRSCPLNVLGDGFSAALNFALQTVADKSRIVMFDEFDASLHVTVLEHLAKFAKTVADSGGQLFLTTHRSDTVDAFVALVEEGWEGLRVFQTRLDAGEVKVQRFGSDRLPSIRRELQLDVRVPS